MRATKRQLPELRKHYGRETSKRVAVIAARGLLRPESLTMPEVRTLAASCLNQVDRIENLEKAAGVEAQDLQQVVDDVTKMGYEPGL